MSGSIWGFWNVYQTVTEQEVERIELGRMGKNIEGRENEEREREREREEKGKTRRLRQKRERRERERKRVEK